MRSSFRAATALAAILVAMSARAADVVNTSHVAKPANVVLNVEKSIVTPAADVVEAKPTYVDDKRTGARLTASSETVSLLLLGSTLGLLALQLRRGR
jgi:hypothetical protein